MALLRVAGREQFPHFAFRLMVYTASSIPIQGLQAAWDDFNELALPERLDDIKRGPNPKATYIASINHEFSTLLLKPKFTVEYTHGSPQDKSPTSNIRLLGDFKKASQLAAGVMPRSPRNMIENWARDNRWTVPCCRLLAITNTKSITQSWNSTKTRFRPVP